MFSIIIPLYNKEKEVVKTIESVFKQTFQDFEIIVVNDGSTDKSVDVINNMDDSRIKLISQKNGGVSKARNTGIKNSNFKFIAFLDADDEWEPKYLEEQYKLSIKYPDCNVFATSYLIKSLDDSISSRLLGEYKDKKDFSINDYFDIATKNLPPLWTSAIVVKKNALNEVKGFPVGITSGEDLLTWARLAAKNKIAYLNKELSIYHNETSNSDIRRLPYPKNTVSEELQKLLKINTVNKRSLNKYISHWHKMRASSYLRADERILSLKECFLSLKFNITNFNIYIFIVLNMLPNVLKKYIISKR